MSEAEPTLIGGAVIGQSHANWPFAKLTADSRGVTLTVQLIGTYEFPISDIVSVEKFVLFPVVAGGIKIKHTVAQYPPNIVFWHFGSPAGVFRFLGEQGFQAAAGIVVQS